MSIITITAILILQKKRPRDWSERFPRPLCQHFPFCQHKAFLLGPPRLGNETQYVEPSSMTALSDAKRYSLIQFAGVWLICSMLLLLLLQLIVFIGIPRCVSNVCYFFRCCGSFSFYIQFGDGIKRICSRRCRSRAMRLNFDYLSTVLWACVHMSFAVHFAFL